MKFNYEGKDYELKYSIRAIMKYENMTHKSFNPQTFSDMITFFYCILCTSARSEVFDYDKVVDALDENPKFFGEFSEWLTGVYTMNNTFQPKIDIKEEHKQEAVEAEGKN